MLTQQSPDLLDHPEQLEHLVLQDLLAILEHLDLQDPPDLLGQLVDLLGQPAISDQPAILDQLDQLDLKAYRATLDHRVFKVTSG